MLLTSFILQVIWDRLYSTKSGTDKGTLFQLKHLIHRTAVRSTSEKSMKSTEDFLLVILHAHITAAAKYCNRSHCYDNCLNLAKVIVEKFVKINLSSEDVVIEEDMQYNYATEFLTLALLWHGFHDALKEGDGNRILRYWRFFIPIFKQEKHYNYAKEAVSLIIQTQVMSPRKVAQLKWSRTVNVHGRVGKTYLMTSTWSI